MQIFTKNLHIHFFRLSVGVRQRGKRFRAYKSSIVWPPERYSIFVFLQVIVFLINFISTKVSRCCFIEQHFIIFRKFPSSKSFLSCQNTKEAEEGVDEARHYSMRILFFIVNISTFVNFYQKLWPFPSTVPGYLKAFFLHILHKSR